VIKRAAKVLGSSNFLYAGPTRQVAEVLANLDLLVVPSIWEGLPRIIVEATISGVQVIASNVDGIREIVTEGQNGAFAKAQDPEDFAKKILRALKEDRKIDPRHSHQIQYDFDIRETVRQQEALYLQLTAHTPVKTVTWK
jgi:glycosyltransferase involved in cell wall biosynthesis